VPLVSNVVLVHFTAPTVTPSSKLILIYRVSIKSFPDYKHCNVAPQLKEFQPWIIFQQDGAPPHWGSDVCRFLDATFSNRWTGRDGPTPWPPPISPDIAPFTSFYGGMLRTSVFDTSSRYMYYKSEGKNNRRYCYNNWRHVGEHMVRNWLSIRPSPCNKWSTYWSALMCCKKKSWVTFWKKKCLYST